MKLVSYARTSGSGDGRDSLDAQTERCAECAARHGHEIVGAFRDEYTCGALPVTARPGLMGALLEIETGLADGLIVHRLDRLARELHIQEAALAQAWGYGDHVEVWEAVEDGSLVRRDDPADPQRRFIRQVLGAAAEFERGLVRARLSAGRARKGAAGGFVGGFSNRYGYQLVGGVFVPDLEEQRAIRRMLAKRAETPRPSFEAIARTLQAEGYPAPTPGGAWGKTTVRVIIGRERAA